MLWISRLARQAILETSAQIGRRAGDADRAQMLHDGAAGDLAGLVTAHAVGHHPKSERRLDQILILVEFANAALVADCPCVKSKETSRASSTTSRASGSTRSMRHAGSATTRHNAGV